MEDGGQRREMGRAAVREVNGGERRKEAKTKVQKSKADCINRSPPPPPPHAAVHRSVTTASTRSSGDRLEVLIPSRPLLPVSHLLPVSSRLPVRPPPR